MAAVRTDGPERTLNFRLMNRIEISVLKPEVVLRTFAGTWHATEAGEGVVPKLAFGSLRALFSAITAKRLELLRYVGVLP